MPKKSTDVLLRMPKKILSVLETRGQAETPEIKVELDHFKSESMGVFPKNTVNMHLTKESQERIRQSVWSCRDITASQIYRSLRDCEPESLACYDGLNNVIKPHNENKTSNPQSIQIFKENRLAPIAEVNMKKKTKNVPKKNPSKVHLAIPSFNQTPRKESQLSIKNKENGIVTSQESNRRLSLLDTNNREPEKDYNYNVCFKSPRGTNFCDFYLPPGHQKSEVRPFNFSTSPKQTKKGNVSFVSKFADKLKIFKSEIKSKALQGSKVTFKQGSVKNFEGSQWNFNERRTASPRTQLSMFDIARRLRSANFSVNQLGDRNPPRNNLVRNFSFLNPNPDLKNAKKSIVISEKESIWSQLIEQLLDKPKITADTMICYYEILGINCINSHSNDQFEIARSLFEKVKSDIVSELKFNLFFRPLVVDDVFDIIPGR